MSGDLGRFTEFAVSMMRLIRPPETRVVWIKGLDVTANYNKMISELHGEWFWIMGDDHVFSPEILIQLLMRDVDVIVPLCMTRQSPFMPVVYEDEYDRGDGVSIFNAHRNLPRRGVCEIHAAGSAGMLIRRHVLEALPTPIFETSGFHQNEDLNLCKKIRDAGFKIHCDVDARLGHIGIVGVFPMWMGEAGWGTVLESGGDLIPLYPPEDEPEAA